MLSPSAARRRAALVFVMAVRVCHMRSVLPVSDLSLCPCARWFSLVLFSKRFFLNLRVSYRSLLLVFACDLMLYWTWYIVRPSPVNDTFWLLPAVPCAANPPSVPVREPQWRLQGSPKANAGVEMYDIDLFGKPTVPCHEPPIPLCHASYGVTELLIIIGITVDQ